MKAMIITKHGAADGLQLREIEKPTPKDNEVLVKVHAATVTAGDVIMRKLKFPLTLVFRLFGMPSKEIPGHELAGEIEAVGKDVDKFKIGDAIFGTTTGLKVGANAEYVCLPESWPKGVLAIKPANMSFEEAAAVPVGGMTALQILRKADIQQGQDVLIYGASGSVGTYAVQLAKVFGAEVTAVCSSRNFEMVKSIGADHLIDYRKEEFTQNGKIYDVIFDAVGKISSSRSKGSLAENGIYLTVQTSTSEKMADLLFLKELLEEGRIKPFIDKRYPLAETAEAHRYVEQGHKSGNVVITIG